MGSMEGILKLHEQNLQIYELIETAITYLENKMFDTMMGFTFLVSGIPTRPIFELCIQCNSIIVTIGRLQYHVKIDAVMHRLKPYTSVGIEEISTAITDELQNRVKDYFTSDK